MENNKERALIRSKQKYGVISQNIMRHPYISTTAKSLYAYLAGFAGTENSAFPGRELICYEMGFNKDTFTKYMWELQCWEIIQIEKIRGKGGKWENNLYILDQYPTYVMMERKEFEEKVWLELQELIKSRKSKVSKNNPGNTAISPCPKISDTVKNDSPCPKLPDMVEPDLVQPDLVNPDTNNNILNNNILKNNILNNNNENLDEISTTSSDQGNNVVVETLKSNITENTEHQPCAADLHASSKQIREKFKTCGIPNLPEKLIKILQRYTYDEVSKIAMTLQDRREKGKVINPVGLLMARPEAIQAILKGEFFPDVPRPVDVLATVSNNYNSVEYTLYVPPEVIEELKNKDAG